MLHLHQLSPSLAPDTASPWLGKLDKTGSRPISQPSVQGFPLDTPKVENPPLDAAREFSPGGSRLLQRELRIKVWENGYGESAGPAPAEQPNGYAGLSQNEQAQFLPALPQDTARQDFEVDDLPTTSMPSMDAPEDADLPTRPLLVNPPLPDPAQAPLPSSRPFPAQLYRQSPQPPSRPPIDQRQQSFSAQVNPSFPGQSPIMQRPVRPALQTPFQQSAPAPTGIVAGPVTSRPVRRKSKMRVVVVLVMLLLLAGGGLAYWIVAYQPFSVPAVTQTSLSFTNTNLGIALHYPQGWTEQLDAAHQSVSFFDANAVDQVNIAVTASNGSSITAYVNKVVARSGLTAQKNLPPIPFAGTTWQQVRGTELVSGATDTETFLVAMRGNHFYTITQVAPSATYADADHLFFSILRASFQFL